MIWRQITDPLHSIGLSAMVAAVPTAFIFWALIIRRMKGYMASLLTAAIALLLAVTVYGMPVGLASLSALHGALYGLFPICWIFVPGLFLFNIAVESGQFAIIRNCMGAITSDRRLQLLLIAFSFGSFLEGTAGFATPVVITAAMLFSLGFDPLYAAGVCLIANTAPVAFGSVGIPIIVASHVSGIPELAISQMVGRTLPFLSMLLPFYLVMLTAGWKRSVEVLPATLVSGLSFALFQWLCSNYMGPMLPDVIAGIASIVCLLLLLRWWKPRTVWRFKNEPIVTEATRVGYTAGQIIKALSPFMILTLIVIAWGTKPVKDALDSIGSVEFGIPGLNGHILTASTGTPLAQVFHLNLLSAAGTAIFLSGLIAVPVLGMSYRRAAGIFVRTIVQLKLPILTVSSVLAFAYISNNSGMSDTLAIGLTATGVLFPFFSPVLGWLGVFITGSDTSSNALFVRLQHVTASAIGVDPVVTVAANCSGGVVAKMISPQSIAVAAAAGGLIGSESKLFRFTVRHSFILLSVICCLVFLQAYVLKGMIPSTTSVTGTTDTSAMLPDVALGYYYLLILTVVLALLIGTIQVLTRKRKIA
jgi:lactate permease